MQTTFYLDRPNPPVLHRKETFVDLDYPFRGKFQKLSQQEGEWGLLDNPKEIGTPNSWQKRLDTAGVMLRGHRVVWQSHIPKLVRRRTSRFEKST